MFFSVSSGFCLTSLSAMIKSPINHKMKNTTKLTAASGGITYF
jgi:hypothetical protein